MTEPQRKCRIQGCGQPSAHHRTVCHRHKTRLVRHGDPHFTTWTVADDTDVAIAASRREIPEGATRLERRLVAVQLTRSGASAAEIARIAGVTPRTVVRWRTDPRTRQDAA